MASGLYRLLRRRPAAWLTLVAGLTLTAALGWEMHREAVELDRQRLTLRVADITSQLDARLEKSEMLLQHLRDFLMQSRESRNPVFARWCYENGLTINCPWILGVAVATNRNKAQWRGALPASPNTWGDPERAALTALCKEHAIDCRLALTSEAQAGRRFLADADYQLQRSYENRDWLSVAIRNSRLGMLGRRNVMRDAAGHPINGTLFVVPVYEPETADFLADGGQRGAITRIRWLQLMSVILAPVDFLELVESIWNGLPSDVEVEVFSSSEQTAATWLNVSGAAPRAADPGFKPYLTHRQVWPMYGNRFSVFCYTTPLFEAQSSRRLARVALAAGTILTLLATALVGVAVHARQRQERMTAQIREARDALAAAQQERNKISRDLHDGTIQALYAIQLGLGHSAEKFRAAPDRAGVELAAVRRDLDSVIAEIRQFITTETEGDKPVNLGAVLQTLVQRARPGTAPPIQLRCDPTASARLAGDQAVQLVNIAREALSNSLRHASPGRVEIALGLDGDAILLEIVDDGAGFEPAAPGRTGVGLTSMTARTREMGGTLEIRSAPGQGTRVAVRIPVSPVEASGAGWPAERKGNS